MNPTFAEVAEVLRSAGADIPAAESHGCLCGALCAAEAYPFERWLEEVLPDEAAGEYRAADGPLGLIFSETVAALRGDQMGFQPLLPDDDRPMAERAAALGQWCQGFLYGLGCGSARRPASEMPGDVDEILQDLARIGQVEVPSGETGEEDERAYAELVEYLRASVQLVHEELAPMRQGAKH